jgi:hypothetical protein
VHCKKDPRAMHKPVSISTITTAPIPATAASPFGPSARFDTFPSKHTTSATLTRVLSQTYKLSENSYQLEIVEMGLKMAT